MQLGRTILGAAVAAMSFACGPPNSGATFEISPEAPTAGGPGGGATDDPGGTMGDPGDPGGTTGDPGNPGGTVGDPGGTMGDPGGTMGDPGGTMGDPGTGGGTSGAPPPDTGPSSVAQINYDLETVDYNGKYDPDHIVAIWIEQGGSFVRTLEVHANRRLDHLIEWRSASGEDMTDAITSATLSRHNPLSGSWDLLDSNRSEAGPGNYVLRAEFTSENSNSGAPRGPTLDVPFSLGSDSVDVRPSDGNYFVGIHIWSE